jgi:hypothetical protein
MKRIYATALCIIFSILIGASLFAQPTVSEKQDVAVFGLGYYGWNIPYETLGSIDNEIQKVFVDLGRFNIIGVTQRLSPGGLDQFIATLKRAKESNFVMPEKFQFGEAFLTEGEFNKLTGAFIVAVPVVTNFNSYYDTKNARYQTTITTGVTYIDVAGGGRVLAMNKIESTGTDKTNQRNSISSAINSIPNQLQFQIRSVSAFQISTRILAASGSEIRLQLGQNMGIRRGDEYSVIDERTLEGFSDAREAGLVVIQDVGPEVSTGSVLYTSIALGKNTQLREIPRQGMDLDIYMHSIGGGAPTLAPGIRATASRGFYGLRPYAAVQIPLGFISSFFDFVEIFPVNVILGAEFVMNFGRLSFMPYAGLGISYFHISTPWLTYETDFVSHIGVQAYGKLAYLLTRDIRLYAELGFEGWLQTYDFPENKTYAGLSIGAGATIKL